MKNSKKFLASMLTGLALAVSLPIMVQAGDLTDKCDNCHGKNGNSEDEKVPSIAGFSAVTLEDIIESYKSGDRPADKYKPKDGEETDMLEISKKLSDDNIKKVAEHYASQKFIPHKQPFDAKLAKKGAKVHKKRCEKCHSDNGSNADDDAAILAGQWRGYLKRQLDLIVSGERTVPKKMKKKIKKLKDGDVEALIEFYASQQ
jgi:sulfide dehydrogenase cytochrome subunit